MSAVGSYFRVKAVRTSITTELIAGATTFMTMSYILFVNPSILSFSGVADLQSKGLPFSQTAAVTALAAGVMTLAMGLFTNYPFALAPGMGLNAVLAFSLVANRGLSWEDAMGVIFFEGLIITVFVLTGVRTWIMNAIPDSLKRSIGVGIGLFIAFIGAKSAGLVVGSSATLVTYGDIRTPAAALALIGLAITGILLILRFQGALLVGILATTLIGAIPWFGQTIRPTDIVGWPDFAGVGHISFGAILKASLWAPIFAIMLSDFFDTMGTVVAVGGEGNLLDEKGRLPRLRRVLLVDSLAAVFGGFLRSSSVTTYVESASGVSSGGRTGLTAVTTGVLFLISIVFAPLFGVVPAAATAPALIIVGFLMMTVVKNIPWDNLTEALPAFLTMILIPLTSDITRGIGYGFIFYTVLKLLTGKGREIHPAMAIISAIFLGTFIFVKL